MKFLKKINPKIAVIIAVAFLVIGGIGAFIFYESKNNEPLASVPKANEPSISAPKMNEPSIDFGYELAEDEKLTIKKVNPEPLKDVEIYAYDFTLSSGQPEGAIEISLPYSDTGLEENEEILSVCAKYFNEETREWEDVVHTVDTENNRVKIITDHLSTYAVFKITNPSKRSAYISEINVYASYMSKDKAMKLLESYGKQGPAWKEDVIAATLESFGSFPMFAVTSLPTLITLGGAYDSYISISFNDSISNLGVATACAQLAYDAYSNGLDSKETAMSALKSTLSIAVNLASPSVQLAYVA